MLRPDFNVGTIAVHRRYKRNAPFKRGVGTRHIMAVLRAASESMTSSEVAKAMLRKAGIAEPTAADIRNARGSVHSTLRRYQGRTVDVVGEGSPVRWKLKP